jgi:hypothetical protein
VVIEPTISPLKGWQGWISGGQLQRTIKLSVNFQLINIDNLPQQGVGKIHAIEIKIQIPSVPYSLGIR